MEATSMSNLQKILKSMDCDYEITKDRDTSQQKSL